MNELKISKRTNGNFNMGRVINGTTTPMSMHTALTYQRVPPNAISAAGVLGTTLIII